MPLAWFEPDASLSRDDWQRIARREVVVKALPAQSSQLGVFAATELRQSPDVFVAWIREMPQLQRSKAVAAIGRFSEPPTLQDLDGLTLDKRDIQSIRECGPGQCALKLSSAEVNTLRTVAHQGSDQAILQVFRQLLLDRLLAYRAGGAAALPVAATRPVSPREVFAALHASSPYIRRSDARLALWLSAPQQPANSDVESFYYWAKEYYASGKPVVVLTQVGVTRSPPGGPAPEVSVVGRQLFATRYMNGMLSHITLSREPGSGSYYMTYSNRAQLDALSGFWGGIVRAIINSRLRGDAASVLGTLRDRIESGAPKVESASR